MSRIFILSGARTPLAAWSHGLGGAGQKGGALSRFNPFDLGAEALEAALAHARVISEKVDKVVFGNMYQAGPHACYGARYLAHRAHIPPQTPCLSVGLACGTGLQALITAASEIELGRAGVVAAAGADCPSLLRRDIFVPSFKDISCGRHIAETAHALAQELGISRAEQDRWALISHARARAAQGRGIFKEEIVPIEGVREDDSVLADPRPDFFARAEPLFENGSITRANTHAIVDGGSALLLAGEKEAEGFQEPPLGRYLGGEVTGVPPERMAEASVPAVRRLLSELKLSPEKIDLYEINETFAAQTLIDIRELGIPEEKVNVNGGALALGHPFAGTGLRLVLTLLKELKRRRLRRGVASICVGGGLGVAVAVEAL
ncbi:MAG: thiolase family protein [Elusimicrobia bacterium]|nr:thiolase family protein [Elusimicrobiota bacterium]